MVQNTLTLQYNNPLEKELIKLFHRSKLPLHFNKTGYKDFTNYQRIALIILYKRSKKGLRDFIKELQESRWTSWLGLIRIPSKSSLHNWIQQFQMKTIRQLTNLLKPLKSSMTAIDGTGFDSHHRSRHYEKRVGLTQVPYAKVDLFIDVDTREIIDYSLVTKHQHDIIAARQFVKRNSLEGTTILMDRGYDCEGLHRMVGDKGGISYAPVRKLHKRSGRQIQRGRNRQRCLNLPDFMGQRSIIEAINGAIKTRFLPSLRSKKSNMKKRELGWIVMVYNLERRLTIGKNNQKMNQFKISFFLFVLQN